MLMPRRTVIVLLGIFLFAFGIFDNFTSLLGFGTWFIDDKVDEAVIPAEKLAIGIIAQAYGNERGVSAGIKVCGTKLVDKNKIIF